MANIVTKILDKVFLAPEEKVEGDLNSYIKALNSGRFNDKICYGISDKDKGFYVIDPIMRPGALYCGGMGSGKSIAMRFTVVTHMVANSHNTFYILVDTLKGMTDYVQLFQDEIDDFGVVIKENPYKKNVVAAVNDSAKIVPVIDMVYEECMARKDEFSRVGANNVYSYDKLIREKDNPNYKGIARIMICIEEFHAIPNSPQVKFGMKVDQKGSIASKMKDLMRIGRSYGIFFMLASQRATSEDIPSQLKPGLSTMMAFRMNNPGEASAMNLPHAQDIGVKQQGRCAYEDGFIQYPYISDSVLDRMLKQYYKPLEGQLLKAQSEEYHAALKGEGNDGMVWIKPYKDIIKFSNQYEVKTIATRMLKAFNINVEIQPNETFVADMIGTKYEDRYAIRLINNREQGSKKEIDALIKGADALNCNKILIIVVEVNPPMAVTSLERGPEASKTTILDNDDLIQIANMLDSKKDLEASGKFAEFYLRYGISDVRDLAVKKTETPISIEKVIESTTVENKKEESVEEVIEGKEEEIIVAPVVAEFVPTIKIEKVEVAPVQENDELRDRLKLEREAYKQKIKEERKKFLDESLTPIELTKKEMRVEGLSPEIEGVEATADEKEEIKVEMERPSSKESLDKDVLLKIRDRLRQNIINERGT